MMRLGGLVAAILMAWALALAPLAMAQESKDADALNAQVEGLYGEGKYAEAVPIAQKTLALRENAFGPDHPAVAQSLNNLAELYRAQGRFADAEPLHKRALSIREKAFGPDHVDVATSLNNLALLYWGQSRFAEAEPLYKRSLSIRENALGLDHPDVATDLNNLAALYGSLGRNAEAETLYKRSLAIREKAFGPDHVDVAQSLNNLAFLYDNQGRFADAAPLYKRSLGIREKALGLDHPDVVVSLNNLAEDYRALGRYSEAEPLYRRALVALGSDHPDFAAVLNNLGGLYRAQGRYADAEPLYKRSLAIREKAVGPDHPLVAISLNNLAEVYRAQGRYTEAEPLYRRALVALGSEHPEAAALLNNLAGLYRAQGRYADAEPLYKRSLGIREKALGSDHPDVAQSVNNLAELYRDESRYPEAEPLYERALAITKKALGPDHPDLATALNNLAELYRAEGRTVDAGSLSKRALAIREKALGPDHPDVATSLNNLAWLSLAQSDWAQAADHWRQAGEVLQRRAARGGAAASTTIGNEKREIAQNSWDFSGRVKAASRLAAEPHKLNESSKAELFETAQWAQSSQAASSLAQMAVRGAAGDAGLADLVRERQDLVSEWQATDKQLIATKSETPDKRNAENEKRLADRLMAIDARLAAIDAIFNDKFPDYAALTSLKPVSIAEIQGQLRDDEALILFLDTDARFNPTPEETFIWAVTKTESRWVKSDLGTSLLNQSVSALRCGLDESAWSGDGRKRCIELSDLDPEKAWRRGRPLPFDLALAHELYKGLFSDIEDLIKDKHLLLVPSGALTSLPFQVLVTKPPLSPPETPDYRAASWLVRDHALTVLPSVASLAALRRHAHASAASEPFIGFGNPVLTGSARCGKAVIPDTCPDQDVQVASANATSTSRSVEEPDATDTYFRNGLADVVAIKRRLCPLPDTAFELTCVARSLGASETNVVLGRAMTETAIKSASLSQYHVLHFATHGLLAGETVQLASSHAEPALVMSPPDTPTEDDDGLLTASEVAGLKLDADWVVMSACNTAGGGAPGAEALSGLAKAFFYAGTRALLVSHWPVNSYFATMLTSRTFAEMKADASIGRSEAFRRAMLALMSDDKRPRAAHPSVWAPFVVVGEGAAPQ